MNDSLAREIEGLIRAGATYEDAPSIGEEVLDIVDAFFARFLSYTEQARHAHVLWSAHTLLMDCWEKTPRLFLVSPEAGCGKTTMMEITGHLVPRADHVADLTPAALYSSVEEAMRLKGGRPTILFDEYDTDSGGRDMKRLINTGHSRNGGVSRKIGGKVKRFTVYAPLMLAGKMGIYDIPETIRTRSIIIPMQKPLPGEKIERWNRRIHGPEAESILWLLQLWAELVHSYALDYLGSGQLVLPDGIDGRDADVWEPLLATAALAGGHWPQRALMTAVTGVTATGAQSVPSPGIDLLTDIRSIFTRLDVEVIFTVDLIAGLVEIDRTRRRLDGKRLARTLHSYGVTETNKTVWIRTPSGRRKSAKGYRREQFEEAWLRYLPPEVTPVTSVTDEEGDDA